jgi:hypothetical protein
MTSVETNDRKEEILLAVENQEAGVIDRSHRPDHQNFREGSKQHLLLTSNVRTLVALPVRDRVGLDILVNRVQKRDPGLGRHQVNIDGTRLLELCDLAPSTLDTISNIEAELLVQPGQLVAQMNDQFVAVPDVLAGG